MKSWNSFLVLSAFTLPAMLCSCVVVKVIDAKVLNPVQEPQPAAPSEETRALHRTLMVADLHADTLMLDRGGVRGIQKLHRYGHADLPRLRQGNVGFQAFAVATVTPEPYSQKLNGGWILPNGQWVLSPLQGWPVRTWFNSRAHALHQAHKWRTNADGRAFCPILTQHDLQQFLLAHYRMSNGNWIPLDPQHQPVATVLGLEGSHALHLDDDDSDSEIAARVREFRAAGFRMLALTHRFDNELAGASEGAAAASPNPKGVTPLGHRLLREMEKQGFICDLSHASGATLHEVLEQYPKLPVLVTHGGIAFEPSKGGVQLSRVLSVEQARSIARRGGIIGIGLWEEAVGEADPKAVAKVIRQCIDDPGIGSKHVVLGSDMDGAVCAAFAADNWAMLTQELRGLPENTLRDVMGGNVIRFFQQHMPRQ